MLNGHPFKDATSENVDKQCSKIENAQKLFASFDFENFEVFKDGSMDPQRAKILTILCVHALCGVFNPLLYTSGVI